MVKPWTREVGDARTVIEPLIRRLDPGLDAEIVGGDGFRNDTVDVRLKQGSRSAHCVITFEAWENARRDPSQMERAFTAILEALSESTRLPTYVLTSRGLSTEEASKDIELVRDIAAGDEADALAERLPKRTKSE